MHALNAAASAEIYFQRAKFYFVDFTKLKFSGNLEEFEVDDQSVSVVQ